MTLNWALVLDGASMPPSPLTGMPGFDKAGEYGINANNIVSFERALATA